MNDIYKLAEKFVEDSFGKGSSANHLIETSKIVKEIDPLSSKELVLAALMHDLERANRKNDIKEILKNSNEGFSDPIFLELHQSRSAKIAYNFLIESGLPVDSAEKVKHLIERHEIGGDEEQNLLMNADSLSFFRVNVDNFVKNNFEKQGRKKVIAKIDWMFNRINSDKVRDMALPLYEGALRGLNE